MKNEIEFVKNILPEHYDINESKESGNIHCVSKIGIRKNGDAENEEHWKAIFGAFQTYFGDRFQEVFHNVCFCHTDFTIYLRPKNQIKVLERVREIINKS